MLYLGNFTKLHNCATVSTIFLQLSLGVFFCINKGFFFLFLGGEGGKHFHSLLFPLESCNPTSKDQTPTIFWFNDDVPLYLVLA